MSESPLSKEAVFRFLRRPVSGLRIQPEVFLPPASRSSLNKTLVEGLASDTVIPTLGLPGMAQRGSTTAVETLPGAGIDPTLIEAILSKASAIRKSAQDTRERTRSLLTRDPAYNAEFSGLMEGEGVAARARHMGAGPAGPASNQEWLAQRLAKGQSARGGEDSPFFGGRRTTLYNQNEALQALQEDPEIGRRIADLREGVEEEFFTPPPAQTQTEREKYIANYAGSRLGYDTPDMARAITRGMAGDEPFTPPGVLYRPPRPPRAPAQVARDRGGGMGWDTQFRARDVARDVASSQVPVSPPQAASASPTPDNYPQTTMAVAQKAVQKKAELLEKEAFLGRLLGRYRPGLRMNNPIYIPTAEGSALARRGGFSPSAAKSYVTPESSVMMKDIGLGSTSGAPTPHHRAQLGGELAEPGRITTRERSIWPKETPRYGSASNRTYPPPGKTKPPVFDEFPEVPTEFPIVGEVARIDRDLKAKGIPTWPIDFSKYSWMKVAFIGTSMRSTLVKEDKKMRSKTAESTQGVSGVPANPGMRKKAHQQFTEAIKGSRDAFCSVFLQVKESQERSAPPPRIPAGTSAQSASRRARRMNELADQPGISDSQRQMYLDQASNAQAAAQVQKERSQQDMIQRRPSSK